METLFITYTVRDIEAQGGQFHTSSYLKFQNQTFQRGLRFCKTRSHAIRAYYKMYQKNGYNIVVIQNDAFITFWKQIGELNVQQPQGPLSITQGQTSEITDTMSPLRERHAPKNSVSHPLSPDIIDCCRTAMLIAVGPIANLILKEVLARPEEMEAIEFIDALRTLLPNEYLKDLFLQELMLRDLDTDLAISLRTWFSQ